MKTLLTLFLLTAAIIAAPTVAITDAGTVTVDGSDYGKIADAIANNKQLAPAIQGALDAHLASLRTAKTEAEAKAAAIISKAEAALADAEKMKELGAEVVAAKQTEKERKVADLNNRKAEIDKQISELSEAAPAKRKAAVKK